MASAYEIVMDSRKELVNSIIENMKKGYIWSPNAWDPSALRPYNPASDCYYLGGNRVRLMMAAIQNNYSDPRWCTFDQAKKNGWAVQKGAKSVLLEKWIFDEIKTVEDPQGNKVEVKEPLEKPKVYYFRVFNATQVHGMPKLAPQHNPDLDKTIETILKSSQCPIVEVANSKASYSPKLDRITVPSRFSFKSEEAFLSVVTHEMSHSTAHPERLNRSLQNTFGEPDYAREELRAELGSALLKCDLQLPLSQEQLQDHSSYLVSWIQVLQNDPNEFFRACRDAEKISSYLYQNYEKTLEIETQITTELNANNLKPEGELKHKIQTLWKISGKNLTLHEIAEMALQPQTDSVSQQLTLAKEIIYLKELSEECLAAMEAAGYEWIESDPELPATVTFQHRETGKCIGSDGWEGIKMHIQEQKIAAELTANHLKPNGQLVYGIYDLWEHTGKELTLKEIIAMTQQPPADQVSYELLDYIKDHLREELKNQKAQTAQTESTAPIEPSKVLRIVTDLKSNQFTANTTLVKNIYSLCQHTGQELTLREISEMVKFPPKDPVSLELLEEIQSECCRQELSVQLMNEFAVEPV